MKRVEIILFIFFILNSSFICSITGETISGEAISGKMTAVVGMNITIIAAPSLSILSPENKTYITNNSLLLNYSASPDTEEIWYSIDGSPNITITSSIYFNVSEGAHSLFLYANNSLHYNATESISFVANRTRFIIIYSEYNGTLKGNSTDFIKYTYEKLQNFSNISLENVNFGKILFLSDINLTDDSNFSDNTADLDNNTNISFNRIELDSSVLPNLNFSSTLWLYGLTFSNPRILMDGSVCPSTICTRESYLGGTLKFNATGFSVYSAEETPVVVPPTGTGAGGGGGAGVVSRKGFSLSQNEIKVKLRQGTFLTEQVIITNLENNELSFALNVSRVSDFIKLNEYSFTLKPRESKVISLDILAREDAIPDLYIGEIIIKAGGIQKNILTAVEIESAQPLFDVKARIPEKFLYVMPGEEVYSEIELYNLGEIEKEVDVDIEYKILDWKGNEISKEHETIAVNTKINYIKTFRIPENAEFGRYVVYVRASYKERLASASAWFNVGKPPSIPLEWAVISLLALCIIITVIIIMKIRKIKKQKKPIKKIDEKALKRVNLIKKR